MRSTGDCFKGGRRVAGWLVVFAACVFGSAGLAAMPPGPVASAPVPPATTTPPNTAAPGYPAGMDQIVRMLNANIDHDTIKAYIENSFTYWNLSADDIITLKERGVPADVVSAILQRDRELREDAMQAAAEAGNPADTNAAATNAVAPGYDNGAYAGTYPYASDYGYPADYGYGYPYSYSYPYPYWNAGFYGWPVWGGGIVFFNGFGHCHFDFNHSHFHGFRTHNVFFGKGFGGDRFAFKGSRGGFVVKGNRGFAVSRGNAVSRGSFGGSVVHSPTFRTGSPSFRTPSVSSPFATRSFGTRSLAFSGHAGTTPRAFAPAGAPHFSGHSGGSFRGPIGGGGFGGHVGGGGFSGHMGGGFGGGMHMGGGGFGGGHGGGGGHR